MTASTTHGKRCGGHQAPCKTPRTHRPTPAQIHRLDTAAHRQQAVTDRQTDRDKVANRQTERPTETKWPTDRHRERKAGRQSGKQTDKKTD